MRNSSVSLYGNLILDKILYLDEFPCEGVAQNILDQKVSLGGIFNIARFLLAEGDTRVSIHSSVGDDLSGDVVRKILVDSTCSKVILESSSDATSTAVILNNSRFSERTGLVYWGACCNMKNFIDDMSEWKHFSYGDSLNNLHSGILEGMSGVKSLDLNRFSHSSQQRARTLECIKQVDFLIASAEECLSISESEDLIEACKKLGKLCNRYAIIHHPEGSLISDGVLFSEVKSGVGKLNNLDVLGAGDIFVGAFIKNYSDALSIGEIVLRSHRDTFNSLVE